jgi:hypothetical protein
VTENPTPDEADQVDDDLELEQLALEKVKRRASIEADKERIDTIDAILRTRLDRGTHRIGSVTVTVKAGAHRLNATRLAAAFPFTVRPELYKPVLDTAAAKQHIAPVDLVPFTDEGTPVVEVK